MTGLDPPERGDADVAHAEPSHAVERLRTPRAAGVAGVAFSLLLGTALILFRLSVPSHTGDPGAWLTDHDRRRTLVLALHLIPFAGIAFLWFMGVVRDRIGHREDRFLATVFLGSGLLFVAMLFTAAAITGGLAAAFSTPGGAPRAEILDTQRRITGQLVNIYALRMAAVFVMSTTTIALRTAVLPRWLAIPGYVVAAILLLNASAVPWVNLLFPLWTLALSIHILAVTSDARDARA